MISPQEYRGCQIRSIDQAGYDRGRIRSTIYVVAQVDFDVSPRSGVNFIFIDQLVNPIKQIGTTMNIANGINSEAHLAQGNVHAGSARASRDGPYSGVSIGLQRFLC